MRTNSAIHIAVPLLVIFLTTNLYAQRPHWFDEVNVLANKGTADFPTTGGTWGFKPLHPEIDDLVWHINYYHDRGTFYHSSMQFQNQWLGANVDSSIAAIDFHGNPIAAASGFEANLHHPAWQDSLIRFVKLIIDLGGDGVIIDGYSPNIQAIRRAGGSFDDYTMEDFRAYLESKYSADELETQFDISDISIFNYGNWLREHGLDPTEVPWSQRMEGLLAEFWLFEWQFSVQIYSQFLRIAKEYAKTKYSKNFVVSENNAGFYYNSANIDDFLIGEFFYYGPGRKTTDLAASHVKVGKAIADKPVLIFPEIVETVGNISPPQHLENMIKLIFADIYASGGTALAADWLLHLREGNYTTPFAVDKQTLSNYASFILENSNLFEKLNSISKVGLVYSFASTFNSQIAIENWNDNLTFPIGYTGMSKLLIEANIQHDVIYLPDPRFPNRDITPEQLSQYNCIVMPNIYSMTDAQADLLLDYVNNGGVIIAAGTTGTHDENGKFANRSVLQSLTNNSTNPHGKGFFVHLNDDIGRRYSDSGNLNYKKLIVDEINKYVLTQTKVFSADTLSVFAYDKIESSSKILHLVNYDYNPNKDLFSPKKDFVIQIQVDTSRDWEAVYLSPDFWGQKLLSTKYEDDCINISIPKLEAYGIVSLQEISSAPQIISYTPQSDTTTIAGETLLFTVKAIDPDKNPLYFKWSVNGILDSTATDTAFTLRTTRADSGIDTVRVDVSDGRHTISKYWYITVRGYIFPKILFDESHNEYNTISLERARQINPDHPEWVYFGMLKSKIEPDYNIERYDSGVISTQVLNNYDALIISAPRDEFLTQEINDIIAFVTNGGGLFFLGDCGLNTSINNLLTAFSIHYINGVIFEPAPPGQDGGNPQVLDFVKHEALGNNPQFDMNWGGSFSVSSPAMALGFTDSTTWRDLDWDKIKDSNEPSGPFTIVCASELGKGRIFCIGDNSLHDDYIKWTKSLNDDLFLNALKWLTESVNQIPTFVKSDIDIPKSYKLYQNYPNPFNPTTNIKFQIPKTSKVIIKIYNMLGQEIKTLVDRDFAPGNHVVVWDGTDNFGRNVSSGIYLYRMKTIDFISVKKGLLLK